MKSSPPSFDHPRHDVRMDGVFFRRISTNGSLAMSLPSGNYSYCVMVRCGNLMLETDFPQPFAFDLAPGDVISVSGLSPHCFRSTASGENIAASEFIFGDLPGDPGAREIELIVGAAPNESLAIGSLMLGPIHVRQAEHPALTRRLWAVLAMIEDEYADSSWIDRNLVIRRLAEIMLVNLSRCAFAVRMKLAGSPPSSPANRQIMRAIDAFFRDPHKAWSLADMAKASGLSRTRFSEEFKCATGQTPVRVIARMRLTAIAHRMVSESLSVEQAAESAGYSTPEAFVRAFQREFGDTPARWRRRREDRAPSERGALRGAATARPAPARPRRQA